MDAVALHKSLLVVDGDCDSALDAAGISATNPAMGVRNLGKRSSEGHIDLPRLLEAGVSAQFFALFCEDTHIAKAREHTWMLLETMEAFIAGTQGIDLGLHASDIEGAKAEGTLAALLKELKVRRCSLLPYHSYGLAKVEKIGGTQDKTLPQKPMNDRVLHEWQCFFTDFDIVDP